MSGPFRTLSPRSRRRGSRRLVACTAAVVGAVAFGASAASGAQLTFRMVRVGAPNNPSVSVVPFTDAIYASCSVAPKTKAGCVTLGSVSADYDIGELEVTVAQYVVFLNTVDPRGRPPQPVLLRRERSGVAQVRADRLRSPRRPGTSLLRRLSRVGGQAIRVRDVSACSAVRQFARQRHGRFQAGPHRRRRLLCQPHGEAVHPHRDRHV